MSAGTGAPGRGAWHQALKDGIMLEEPSRRSDFTLSPVTHVSLLPLPPGPSLRCVEPHEARLL